MTRPNHFIEVDYPDPHRNRRQHILKAHPEVATLYGYEHTTKYFIVALLIAQLAVTYYAMHLRWWWILILLYTVGATINHLFYFLIHECVHGLAAKTKTGNLVWGIIANLTIGIPITRSFQKYHLDHHRYFGSSLDSDIPFLKEAQWCNSRFKKVIWLLSYPLIYMIRPLLIIRMPLDRWDYLNITAQLLFDIAVVWFLGWGALLYLIASTLVAISFHPLAAHFISEHYVTNPAEKQETYSYYGLWNWLSFNFGHHTEHHDFARIPWSKLPTVRNIAPEFYNHLHIHRSWLGFMFYFISSKEITLFNRVTRK